MKKLKLLAFGGCLFLLTGCNASLFYYPSKNIFSTPKQLGLEYQDHFFSSADGTELHGWFIPNQSDLPTQGTLVQLHGNAENISTHYLTLAWLVRHGYHLFTFDYRGYGQSEGHPSFKGPIEDAIAALEYIQTHPQVDPKQLTVIGQSLGGAIATAALPQVPEIQIKALVLEGTFSSYQRIARDKMEDFWIGQLLKWPLSWLLIRDYYSPEEWIAQISPTPLLLIHGSDDPIVPYYHAPLLLEAAPSPKTHWKVSGGEHLDTFSQHGELYRNELLRFLATPKQYQPSPRLNSSCGAPICS